MWERKKQSEITERASSNDIVTQPLSIIICYENLFTIERRKFLLRNGILQAVP